MGESLFFYLMGVDKLKEIQITQGKKVLVSDEDFKEVSKYKWSYSASTGYAVRKGRKNCNEPRTVHMHRVILKAKANEQVDHINGNKLDNRKSNLRIVSQQNNTQARKTFIRNNTGVLGISYRENKNYKYYRVSITDPVTLKRFTKQFNINKLGKEKAFELANYCLNQKKKEFNYTI